MTNLRKGLASFILFIFCIAAKAQIFTPPVNEPNYNQPRIFSDLPDTILFPSSLLGVIVNLNEGQNTSFNISTTFSVLGVVSSAVNKYKGTLKSVVISCSNRPGAALTLSQITVPEEAVSYNGRIMSFQSGDGFELQLINGKYYLIKRNFYDIVND